MASHTNQIDQFNKRYLAFTMIEILVVLAIIMIVGAISYPVFQTAKRNSNRAVCFSNLKQLHLATTLYRMDSDRDSVFGTPEAMGLPSLRVMSTPPFPQVNCAMPNPQSCSGYNAYRLAWIPAEFSNEETNQKWARYVQFFQGRSILIHDIGHSMHCPITPISISTGIGVTIEGNIASKTKRGNPEIIPNFYHDQGDNK